jgi:hypothetical protein
LIDIFSFTGHKQALGAAYVFVCVFFFYNSQNCFNKESVRPLTDVIQHVNGAVKRIIPAKVTQEPVTTDPDLNPDEEIKTAAKALLQLSATYMAIGDAVDSSASL